MQFRTLALLALLAIALTGTTLLGRGLTGMVISQSCCFPPNCSQENICDAAKPQTEGTGMLVGASLILVSLLFYRLSAKPLNMLKREEQP